MLPVTLVDGFGNAGEAGQLDVDTEFFFDYASVAIVITPPKISSPI